MLDCHVKLLPNNADHQESGNAFHKRCVLGNMNCDSLGDVNKVEPSP